MTCACGVEIGRPHARFCDACRWKHRGRPLKYPLTPERAAYLRAHYRPTGRRKGQTSMVYRVARVLGVPKWRVCRWAAELGLTGPDTRGPQWTPEDDAFLEAHLGTRHVHWIAKRLHRSVTAVTVRAKRIGLSRRDGRSWYTARQVADGFGVDPSTVVRWIETGKLRGQHEGQDHPGGRAAAWRVEHGDLRHFAQAYPTAYSLAKVDQVFFLDLAFGSIGLGQNRAA